MVPEVGKRYIIKHAGSMTETVCVRIEPKSQYHREHYVFRKVQTGREVRLKSRVKILGLA